MNKHLPLVLLRLLIAYCLVRVMASTHVRWGQQYPGDGQDAFGFVLIFLGIGAAAAALYFIFFDASARGAASSASMPFSARVSQLYSPSLASRPVTPTPQTVLRQKGTQRTAVNSQSTATPNK